MAGPGLWTQIWPWYPPSCKAGRYTWASFWTGASQRGMAGYRSGNRWVGRAQRFATESGRGAETGGRRAGDSPESTNQLSFAQRQLLARSGKPDSEDVHHTGARAQNAGRRCDCHWTVFLEVHCWHSRFRLRAGILRHGLVRWVARTWCAQAIAPEVHGGPPTSAKTHSRGDARSWKSETWKFGSDSGRWRRLSHDSWRTGAPRRGEGGEEHVSPLKCEKGSRSWLRSERSFDCFRWRKHQTEKAKSQRLLYIPHHSAGGQRRAFGAKRAWEGLRAPSGAHYIKYRPRCQGSGAGWHVVCKQDWQLQCPVIKPYML